MKSMRTRKDFYVVAYDISSDRRRRTVSKLLEKYGCRRNASVFECMVTESEFRNMIAELNKLCNHKKDSILIYPLCLNCFSKSVFIPERKETVSYVKLVI